MWTPIFVPTTHGFQFFAKQTWIFMVFYGLLQLYAQQVWIHTLYSTRMDFYLYHTGWDLYVFLYFATHTWIYMDSTDFFYFMDFYGLLFCAKQA